MARSDLLLSLIKAGVSGDLSAVRTTAEAIAADERAKRHTGLAERIIKSLDAVAKPNSSNRLHYNGARERDGATGILRRDPERPIADLYLHKAVRSACAELIEEQRRSDVLRGHGLEPRHRVLLIGPPGNGKTSLAESIAYELALPLFTVRYDAVVTSYLGETAQRLRRLFDFVRTEPCVLFFDEFDALGKERGDLHETGEIKRVVTTLLLQLDDLPSYCILVGATNHPELLDRATWRRFEFRLVLDKPTEPQLVEFFGDKLRSLGSSSGYTAKRLVSAIDVSSFSEAETFFLDVRRRLVLAQGQASLRAIIDDRVRAWVERETALKLSKEVKENGSSHHTSPPSPTGCSAHKGSAPETSTD